MLPNEGPLLWAVQSKHRIIKVVFLAAVVVSKEGFYREIGIWPFTKEIPAMKNSKNCRTDYLVTTPVSVTRELYRETLIKTMLPEIKDAFSSAPLISDGKVSEVSFATEQR